MPSNSVTCAVGKRTKIRKKTKKTKKTDNRCRSFYVPVATDQNVNDFTHSVIKFCCNTLSFSTRRSVKLIALLIHGQSWVFCKIWGPDKETRRTRLNQQSAEVFFAQYSVFKVSYSYFHPLIGKFPLKTTRIIIILLFKRWRWIKNKKTWLYAQCHIIWII